MYSYSNMRNKQMVINTCQILPLFKIPRTRACKMTPFSWFREFAPPIEKIPPFFRENWYERSIRFGRGRLESPLSDSCLAQHGNNSLQLLREKQGNGLSSINSLATREMQL